MNQEKVPIKTESLEIVEKYLKKLERFLRPPYTFDLPPTSKRLLPEDENYTYYMCRNSPLSVVTGTIELLLTEDIPFTPEEREALNKTRNVIYGITLGNTKNRTKDEMETIKKGVEKSVEILKTKTLLLQTN